MSIRHQFSYWLEARPSPDAGASANTIIQDAESCGILLPNGPLVGEIDWNTNTFTAQIPEDTGTIEEDRILSKAVTKFAAMHPGLDITFQCLDEEDKSYRRCLRFSDGAVVSDAYARTLDPDELDTETIKAVAKYLNDRGYNGIAHMVAEHFKNVE